ncbi:hypothetical protein SA2200_06830 [Aggregatibacter actinomycetemcomitans serotype d str. SA2200]|nr:hypothetical protein SA2200_06830 [Aggregatibacter actinomycetemcomitans serotype d str. SA2200]KYK96439.1 hypothetical protein SA3733_02295 [Aggregatibacter actinomycetemcomitans serotype d str. SA3733]
MLFRKNTEKNDRTFEVLGERKVRSFLKTFLSRRYH